MNIGLIGATGNIGSQILITLVARGHAVTAIARQVETLARTASVRPYAADLTRPEEIVPALSGHDAIISAAPFTPGSSAGLLGVVRASSVKRALFVGGAGSLKTRTGRLFIEDLAEANVPQSTLDRIHEGRVLLALLREDPALEWTFLSPPLKIGPGETLGRYRAGCDDALYDESGESHISYCDYALAMVDALERGEHIRARFTVGY